MKIGQSIKHLRKNHAKQNQAEFSNAIGITQAYLSRVENDHCEPTLCVLHKIAKHINVPLPVLFWFGVDESDIDESKIEAFRMLKPTIDSMINEVFKK